MISRARLRFLARHLGKQSRGELGMSGDFMLLWIRTAVCDLRSPYTYESRSGGDWAMPRDRRESEKGCGAAYQSGGHDRPEADPAYAQRGIEAPKGGANPDSPTPSTPFGHCACPPYAQRWHIDAPERCTNCGGIFVPYSRARECYSAEECGGTCKRHRLSPPSSQRSRA